MILVCLVVVWVEGSWKVQGWEGGKCWLVSWAWGLGGGARDALVGLEGALFLHLETLRLLNFLCGRPFLLLHIPGTTLLHNTRLVPVFRWASLGSLLAPCLRSRSLARRRKRLHSRHNSLWHPLVAKMYDVRFELTFSQFLLISLQICLFSSHFLFLIFIFLPFFISFEDI